MKGRHEKVKRAKESSRDRFEFKGRKHVLYISPGGPVIPRLLKLKKERERKRE